MFSIAVPHEHKETIQGFIQKAVSKNLMQINQPLTLDVDGWSFFFNYTPFRFEEDEEWSNTGIPAAFVDTRENKWVSKGLEVANYSDTLVYEKFYFRADGTYEYRRPRGYLEDSGLFDGIVQIERNRLPQRVRDNPGYAQIYAVTRAAVLTIPDLENQYENGRLFLMRRLLKGE